MNGRVYDPLLARFGTADPTTEAPFSTQNWNRYSYVGNSPLNFTDPSGYCFMGCFWKPVFSAIGSFVRHNWGSLVQIAAAAICSAVGGPALGSACGAAASAIVTGITSGDLGKALRAGLISAVTAIAFYGVGELTGSLGLEGILDPIRGGHGPLGFMSEAHLFNIAGHALVGCGSAVARGGKCGPGALSGAAGSFVGPMVEKAGFWGGLVITSTVGGLASVAGGGKFGNGAVTAAFGYLFNSMWRSRTPVPLLDDKGNTVLNQDGDPMMRPSDVDPHYFTRPQPGELRGLMAFGQGGDWDVQRVGPDRVFIGQFVDFATVAIGLYGAQIGMSADQLLSMQDEYARQYSRFADDTVMDSKYTHLPARNVYNTYLGYDLYRSGRIR
jgi:hypothetical protein